MHMEQKEVRRQNFLPYLLKVEVSADQINPGETLWITSWWQNIGDCPSERPLQGFVEMQFGHQRIVGTKGQYYRTYWNPYPGTHCWNKGDVWKTTCRWNVRPDWSGTFKLFVGLCNEQHVPVQVYSGLKETTTQVYIGDIEVGWGWGQPTVERTRKKWSREFGKPEEIIAEQASSRDNETIEIGEFILVELEKNRPVLWGLNNGTVSFEFKSSLPEIVLRDKKNDRLIYSFECGASVFYSCKNVGRNSIEYQCDIYINENYAAGFTMLFRVNGKQLEITIDNEREANGFELLEIRVVSLVSGTEKDSCLVEFFGGGRLIPLDKAAPIGYIHNYDTRNAAALFNSKGILVLESYCLDDKMYVSVQENLVEKRASLGFSIINRVRARGRMESIKVQNTHRIEINLLDESFGKPSWQAVARFLRKNLKGKNRDIYRRVLLYKAIATQGPEPPPGRVKDDSPYPVARLTFVTKFKDILEQIRQYYNIFDGMPQVIYIGGFQKGGFDNSYPYTFETDERAGTIEDLRNCIREGKKYNAVVGLHDNFDDCTPGEHFDPRIVCMDEEGGLWKGWIWASGLTYNISPYKYANTGLMQERVKKTVELYGLHTSNHLDVLTSELLRYDYDPMCPASADLSVKGKYAVIEEFNKYGIDITSETLTHPFVGHIGYALWTREDRGDVLFPGERYIPLTYMVYHGIIGYCGPSGNKVEFLWSLVRGNCHFVEEHHTNPENIKWIYLQNIPLGFLYDKIMQDVIEEGNTVTVIYDEKTRVKVDFDTYDYEVVVDGQLIAKDWTVFVPGFREGSYLAYSVEGGKFTYPAPSGWKDGIELRAVTLTLEGEGEEVACIVKEGMFEMEIPAGMPVRIIPVIPASLKLYE